MSSLKPRLGHNLHQSAKTSGSGEAHVFMLTSPQDMPVENNPLRVPPKSYFLRTRNYGASKRNT